MFSNHEFEFKTKWDGSYQKPSDPFWISLNPMKMRTQHGGSGLLVTQECTSIEQLASEVERLKADLDQALADARKALGG